MPTGPAVSPGCRQQAQNLGGARTNKSRNQAKSSEHQTRQGFGVYSHDIRLSSEYSKVGGSRTKKRRKDVKDQERDEEMET